MWGGDLQGLLPRVDAEAGPCGRPPGPGIGMLRGIIFQQMGAGGGTSLDLFQPGSPTALAAVPFILGQRLLIFLSCFPPYC